MSSKINRSIMKLSVQSLLVAATALLLWGCGGGGGSQSYDSPKAIDNTPINGAATSVLVDAETLKSWMDEGLVGNTASSYDGKIVILDFGAYNLSAAAEDQSPRIEGSCRVEQGMITGKRFEGVGDATPLVATGAQMDAVIQRLGIDANTTIVFTTDAGNAGYFTTRAYWTFRYWGFPRERLKVLNGGNTAFAAAYPELMTQEIPTPVASTYSVRDLAGLNDDLRASVGEMIDIVKTLPTSTTNMVFDARGSDYYNGNLATSALITGDVVVFDGHPAGGEFFGQGALYNDPDGDGVDNYKGGTFKETAAILDMFDDKASWSADKKATVYCTSGYSATPLFFVLDAMLGVDVQLYDGSWSQLGKYSEYATAGGELPVGSNWAIDSYMDPATLNYNDDLSKGLLIEPLNGALATPPAPFIGDEVNPAANQVEVADLAIVGTGGANIFQDSLTDDVLIEPATLQAWKAAGLVNSEPGAQRVIILDVTGTDEYAAGHIPDAQLWNVAGQGENRLEGPAIATNMVLTPANMNARLADLAIDEYTTIVLTSSKTASYFPSRAYFTFRYYGWPKSHIKVLNGYNFAWDADDLTDVATDLDPLATPLTVETVGNLQPDLRVSLPELMDAVRDDRGVTVDFRGAGAAAAGSTGGVWSNDHDGDGDADADVVVFEGTMKGGEYYPYAELQQDTANGDYRFKPALIIENALTSETGLDGTETVYSMCRTAYIASTGFFVLDALLDWPVMVYDGSWSQWGSLSDNAAMDGELAAGSEWALDNATYMEDDLVYNKAALKIVEPLNPDADALLLAPANANQVEDADYDYQIQDSGSSSSDDDAATSDSGSAGGNC